MLSIHPDARATPAVRAEIARSPERTGMLVRCYGVSTETIREVPGITIHSHRDLERL
ncbi:IS481 family transposase, partial [Geminicoccaceae bacterium SYSU G07066]